MKAKLLSTILLILATTANAQYFGRARIDTVVVQKKLRFDYYNNTTPAVGEIWRSITGDTVFYKTTSGSDILFPASGTGSFAGSDSIARLRTSPQKTLYVSPTFTGLAAPYYETIQEAVSAAGTNDVIKVSAGTYSTSSVNIQLPVGVHIEGDGQDNTFILNTATGSYWMFLMADSVKFSNLTIRSTHATQGVSIISNTGAKGVEFDHVTIQRDNFTTAHYLVVSAGGYNIFRDCILSDVGLIGGTPQSNSAYAYSASDTSLWYNTDIHSNNYCYGGTHDGYGRFENCHLFQYYSGYGDCINAYGGSTVEFIGGSMHSNNIPISPTPDTGPVSISVRGGTKITTRRVFLGLESYVYPLTLKLDGVVVEKDSNDYNNNYFMYVAGGQGDYQISNTTFNYTGTARGFDSTRYVLGLYTGSTDSSVWTLNNVNFNNCGILISSPNATIRGTGVHVLIQDTATTAAKTHALTVYSAKDGSFFDKSTFTDYNELAGYPFQIDGDSTFGFSACTFTAHRNSIPQFYFGSSALFKNCTFDAGIGSIASYAGNPKLTNSTVIADQGIYAGSNFTLCNTVLNGVLYAQCTQYVDALYVSGVRINVTQDYTSNLLVWLKAEKTVDPDFVASENGDSVRYFVDQSGNGFNLYSSNSPKWIYTKSSSVEIPYVLVSGAGDYDNGAIPKIGDFTVFFVGQTSGSDEILFVNDPIHLWMGQGGDDKIMFQDGTNTIISDAFPKARSAAKYVLMWRRTGTVMDFTFNSIAIGGGTVLDDSVAFTTLGALSGDHHITGKIYEIRLYNEAVSSTDEKAILSTLISGYQIGSYVNGLSVVTETLTADSIYARAYGNLPAGGSGTFGGLTDVDTTGKVNGSVIKYNTGSGKWEVGTDNTGGGGFTWAVDGSSTAGDSLRFHNLNMFTWTQTGNAVTASLDTTTAFAKMKADIAARLTLALFDDSVANYISDVAYGAGWNGVTTIAPSKNAVYDQMETLLPKAQVGDSIDAHITAQSVVPDTSDDFVIGTGDTLRIRYKVPDTTSHAGDFLKGDLTWGSPAGSGDIEGVTAGTAITGGGTSGTVTVNADTGFYAMGTRSGFLKNLDWTAFDAKLDWSDSTTFLNYIKYLVTLKLNISDTASFSNQFALKAPIASPSFTGTVTLPTGLTGTLRAASGVVSATASDTVGLALALAQKQDAGSYQPLDAALTAIASGSDFVKFSGPASTVKTFTLPDADATLLYSGGALGTPSSGSAANLTSFPTLNQNTTGYAGGLSIASQAAGDLFYATSSTALGRIPNGTGWLHLTSPSTFAWSTPTYSDVGAQQADADLSTLAGPTAWRVFYSNGSSTITELALGADGTYLKSNGASSAPTFASPSGTGDMLKSVYDTDNNGKVDSVQYLDSTQVPILDAVAGQILYQKDATHVTGFTMDSAKVKLVANLTSDAQTQLDGKMPKAQVQTKEFTILDTVKTGGETVWSWKVPYAITITQVSAYTDANTVTFQLEERAAATPNTTGTTVMTSSLVADNNEQTTTSFTNAGQAANTWLTAVVSTAGDVSRFCVTIWYTID